MNNEITTTENYAKAIEVHKKIIANAQIAQSSILEMGKGLKEMCDGKLYKELGYATFEDYTQREFGMNRNQAYKYISITENLSEDFVSSRIQNAGVTKLYLLSTLSEEQQAEITDVADIEKITVKELKEQIKELERRTDNITQEKAHAEAEIEALQNVNGKLIDKSRSLERQLKAIEDKPVEVAVEEKIIEVPVPNEEYEKKLKDFEQKKEQTEKEIAKLKAEISRRAGQQPESPEKIKFKILLTAAYDSVQRAVEFVRSVDNSQNRELYLKQIRKIMTMIN